jgi:hypothetical protein
MLLRLMDVPVIGTLMTYSYMVYARAREGGMALPETISPEVAWLILIVLGSMTLVTCMLVFLLTWRWRKRNEIAMRERQRSDVLSLDPEIMTQNMSSKAPVTLVAPAPALRAPVRAA